MVLVMEWQDFWFIVRRNCLENPTSLSLWPWKFVVVRA
ncbi:hypothetical protein E2C01_099331 [Portunus trituberculatus]|uniref:Uncharacterized protein n=1 Tax=Portunus trituberculatus TaxID=210409 RepID=A0A5B7KAI7_PORTR|nr:hypothetical protein [Portunus trituberculatus]